MNVCLGLQEIRLWKMLYCFLILDVEKYSQLGIWKSYFWNRTWKKSVRTFQNWWQSCLKYVVNFCSFWPAWLLMVFKGRLCPVSREVKSSHSQHILLSCYYIPATNSNIFASNLAPHSLAWTRQARLQELSWELQDYYWALCVLE